MRSALALIALLGCADATNDDGRDRATDDIEDAEAKLDGAVKPVGLYKLIDPYSFEEGMPRFEWLDLRRDGTFYIYEIGPVLDEGNFSEGYNSYFGTYTLTKDRYGNKYVRVSPERGGSWREKYTLAGDVASFYYRGGEVGWTMHREPALTAADRKAVRDGWESGEGRRKFSDRADVHPDAMWSRYYDIRDIAEYTLATLRVGDTVYYTLSGGGIVEIYAANNQLVANGTIDGDRVTWNLAL